MNDRKILIEVTQAEYEKIKPILDGVNISADEAIATIVKATPSHNLSHKIAESVELQKNIDVFVGTVTTYKYRIDYTVKDFRRE